MSQPAGTDPLRSLEEGELFPNTPPDHHLSGTVLRPAVDPVTGYPPQPSTPSLTPSSLKVSHLKVSYPFTASVTSRHDDPRRHRLDHPQERQSVTTIKRTREESRDHPHPKEPAENTTEDDLLLEDPRLTEERKIAERRRKMARLQAGMTPRASLLLDSAPPLSTPPILDSPHFGDLLRNSDSDPHEMTCSLGKADAGRADSAADYDPLQSEPKKKVAPVVASSPALTAPPAVAAGGGDDDNDMFADTPSPAPTSNTSTLPTPSTATAATLPGVLADAPVIRTSAINSSLVDNWDDPEGYYNTIVGEMLNDRYHVYGHLGKGVFSTVVKARDTLPGGTHGEVAIKIVRNNDTMRRAGLKELSILRKLAEVDPEGKRHVVRILASFEHRGHLCLVFEALGLNLREVLRKFGREVGLNLRAIRSYAQQAFLALSLLRRCRIIHADIKPDNILVTEGNNLLKVCDLGSAASEEDAEITPYLVSRFYRAPEIILGLPYDAAIDVWSMGCTLYELYTGRILFPGRTNNQMLRMHMDLKGRFAHRVIRRGQFFDQHFDPEDRYFLSHEVDRLTRKDTIRKEPILKASQDLRQRLLGPSRGSPEDHQLLLDFIDFLDRCLSLSPDKRLTPKEALRHPFLLSTS